MLQEKHLHFFFKFFHDSGYLKYNCSKIKSFITERMLDFLFVCGNGEFIHWSLSLRKFLLISSSEDSVWIHWYHSSDLHYSSPEGCSLSLHTHLLIHLVILYVFSCQFLIFAIIYRMWKILNSQQCWIKFKNILL